MQPRTFHVFGQIHHCDVAIQLRHIRFQPCQKASAVSPAQPCLAILLNQHGGVYIIPPPPGTVGSHVVRHQRSADSIRERPCGTIAYRHSNGFAHTRFACLHRGIIIELSISFYHLRSPRFSHRPFKVGRAQYSTMLCPVLHISRRVTQPFGNIELPASRSRILSGIILIVSDIQIQPIAMYQCGRVGRKVVSYQRISLINKCFLILFRATSRQQA